MIRIAIGIVLCAGCFVELINPSREEYLMVIGYSPNVDFP